MVIGSGVCNPHLELKSLACLTITWGPLPSRILDRPSSPASVLLCSTALMCICWFSWAFCRDHSLLDISPLPCTSSPGVFQVLWLIFLPIPVCQFPTLALFLTDTLMLPSLFQNSPFSKFLCLLLGFSRLKSECLPSTHLLNFYFMYMLFAFIYELHHVCAW